MQDQTRNKNHIIRLITLFILLIVVSFIPYEILFDKTHSVCIHNHLFGFQCPFCGLTRAVYQTVHLQFASAINYNIVVVLLPFYLGINIAIIFIRKKWLLVSRKIIVVLIIASLLVLYAFRIYNYFNSI